MTAEMRCMSCFVVLLCALPSIAIAKRIPPRRVDPVTLNGVEYKAAGDGKTAWIVAASPMTHEELWKAKVFHIHIHWWKGEEDNQWVFISLMRAEGGELFIKDERSRCYRLDLVRKKVSRAGCH